MRIPAPLHQAMVRLNVWSVFMQMAQKVTSFQQAKDALAEVKSIAKRNYIEQAKQLHPDVGGDPEEMKSLNTAMDLLKEVELVPPPPKPRVIIHYYSAPTTCWTSDTTNT